MHCQSIVTPICFAISVALALRDKAVIRLHTSILPGKLHNRPAFWNVCSLVFMRKLRIIVLIRRGEKCCGMKSATACHVTCNTSVKLHTRYKFFVPYNIKNLRCFGNAKIGIAWVCHTHTHTHSSLKIHTRFSLKIWMSLRSKFKHSKLFILWFLNTDKLNVINKTRLRLVFSTSWSVFTNQRKYSCLNLLLQNTDKLTVLTCLYLEIGVRMFTSVWTCLSNKYTFREGEIGIKVC